MERILFTGDNLDDVCRFASDGVVLTSELEYVTVVNYHGSVKVYPGTWLYRDDKGAYHASTEEPIAV